MTKHIQFKAKNPGEALEEFSTFVNQYDFERPLKVECEPFGNTLDYKAVFWIWMNAIAKQLTARGHKLTPEEAHDLMCHKFLGYTEGRWLGKTEIRPALVTITYPKQLERGEFFHFMQRIEDWCTTIGVRLPAKPSQYEQDREEQVA